MKIERDCFTPVVITLETLEEAKLFMRLLAHGQSRRSDNLFDFADKMLARMAQIGRGEE